MSEEQLVHRSVEHLHGPEEVSYKEDELVVVCLVRDAGPLVKPFVEHYFSLGVKHVAFLDNGSTDGTVEALEGYDNVTVLRSRLSYKSGSGERVGNGWTRECLFKQYLIGRGKLRWVGDKYSGYTRWIKRLANNNLEARFIVLYRPAEEVAESWEARSRNLDDPWLGGKNGFELGIDTWNKMLNRVRKAVEGGLRSRTLIISYHDFFERNEDCLRLISWFLNLKFDDSVREAWKQTSREFKVKRRPKQAPTKEQETFLQNNKDQKIEEWFLDRIEQQWEDLELYEAKREELVRSMDGEPHRLANALLQSRVESEEYAANIRLLEWRVGNLKRRLKRKSTNVQRLKKRNKHLDNEVRRLSREADDSLHLLNGLRTKLSSFSTRIFGFRQR